MITCSFMVVDGVKALFEGGAIIKLEGDGADGAWVTFVRDGGKYSACSTTNFPSASDEEKRWKYVDAVNEFLFRLQGGEWNEWRMVDFY